MTARTIHQSWSSPICTGVAYHAQVSDYRRMRITRRMWSNAGKALAYGERLVRRYNRQVKAAQS